LHLIIESFFSSRHPDQFVFRGQYLPLSLSKRGVPYIKKTKRKKKASAKQKRAAQNKKYQKCGCPILPSLLTYPILPRLKLVRSGLSILSNFTKPVNLSDFTRAENWSVLPDFTKAANLSVFTRAENWSDLACPFCPILPRLRTCPILPELKTGPILLVRFA
jgi:hypothetical protein